MSGPADSLFESPGHGAALADGALLMLLASAVSTVATLYLLSKPPPGLLRANYRDKELPVVLGLALLTGAIVSLAVAGLLDMPGRALQASLVVVVGFGLAGAWDDLRGDERPRGFAGHLGALRGGRVTGGSIKLVVGGIVGLAGAWIIGEGDVVTTVLGGLAIALAANLINLLDRAPGRASKSFLALLVPVAFGASPTWLALSGSVAGGAAATLPPDLRERGMLGDAGANPLGAMLGLGIADSPRAAQAVAVILLAGLNIASERWSFSALIERTPLLRALDRAGRRP